MLVFDYDTLELARTYFMKLIVVCIGKAELVTGMMLKAIPSSSYFGVVLRPPPQLFFNEIAGFKTSSRTYYLKYGALCHPDATIR